MNISIIIPCYDSGNFLLEAIDSVRNSGADNYEIVVVDDGSTAAHTLAILKNLESTRITLISQKNQGPAAARNRGVDAAKGDYFLFLDADNLILPGYLEKASAILTANQAIGVVYANPSFIGDMTIKPRFYPKPYSGQALLLGNYIDMCSLVRRELFEELGGFDEHLDLIGWEDWEFWLRVSQTHWGFHYLNEELFKYRIRKDSLMGLSTESLRNKMLAYLGKKHGKLFHELLRSAIRTNQILEKRTPHYWFKKWFPSSKLSKS
jgi:glycosyltransferase involved in cell wall biosynthesis